MSSLEYQFRDTVLYRVTYEVRAEVVHHDVYDEPHHTGKYSIEKYTKVIATNVCAHSTYRIDHLNEALMFALNGMHSDPRSKPEIINTETIGGIDAWVMR